MIMSFYIGQTMILAEYNVMQPGTGMHAMDSDGRTYMLMYYIIKAHPDNAR